MKNIGFVNSNYPNEKRIAILPEDIKKIKTFDKIYIEKGYARFSNISDEEYAKEGCLIASREEIFQNCDMISHLKLIGEADYKYMRDGLILIGWTHPYGSGKKFFEFVSNKDIIIVDLDNIYPAIFYKNRKVLDLSSFIPKNFIRDNSVLAGQASIISAFVAAGIYPSPEQNAAVLSAGNVSQGALEVLTNFGCKTRVFTRSNMDEFIEKIGDYDIIVNGIEFSGESEPIISNETAKRIKKGTLVIDSAADAGAVIEPMPYTTHENPFHEYEGAYYWCINNIPSLFYKTASKNISKSFTPTYDIDYRELLKEQLANEKN